MGSAWVERRLHGEADERRRNGGGGGGCSKKRRPLLLKIGAKGGDRRRETRGIRFSELWARSSGEVGRQAAASSGGAKGKGSGWRGADREGQQREEDGGGDFLRDAWRRRGAAGGEAKPAVGRRHPCFSVARGRR